MHIKTYRAGSAQEAIRMVKKEMGADAVTTTLLFSIYQDHDTVAGIGREEYCNENTIRKLIRRFRDEAR